MSEGQVLKRPVTLIGISRKSMRTNFGAQGLGDFHRPVGAHRVHDQDFGGPPKALQTLGDIRLFVAGQHQNADRSARRDGNIFKHHFRSAPRRFL